MPSTLDIRNILIAGVIGQLAFEAYAWLLSPVLFGLTLEPSNLVMALSKIYLGVELSYGLAFVVHFIIGSAGFASLVWIMHEIIKRSFVVAGAFSGFVLWFVAQGILAPAIGRPFMMAFGAYTQSSAIAHIGMTVVMGLVLAKLAGGQSGTRLVKSAE